MFGIGIPELILILVVGLIVFGPGKLPEMGRTLGKGIREFRKASNALTAAINAPEPPPVQPTQPAPQHSVSSEPAAEQQAASPTADNGHISYAPSSSLVSNLIDPLHEVPMV